MVRVPLVEDVVFISLRVVHRRARIVEPASRGIDMAVWSPTSEEGTVAHGPDLVGIDRRTLAIRAIIFSQRGRQTSQKGGAKSESLHHHEP